MRQAMVNGEVDACFPAYADFWTNERSGLIATNSVYTVAYNLIYNETYPDM